MATPKKRGRYGTIFQYVNGSWRFYILALAANMMATVFNFLTPQIIRFTVDSVIGVEPADLPIILSDLYQAIGGRDTLRSHLGICAIAVVIVALLNGLCNFTSRIATTKASEGFVRRIRNALFKHIQKLPYQWHMDNQTGDIIQRCTSDVEVMRGFVTNQLLEICRTVFLVVFAMSRTTIGVPRPFGSSITEPKRSTI